MAKGTSVRVLGESDVADAADVLCESFYDYPVMRFALGTPDNYDHQLRTLIHFFVMSRVFRKEVLLGVGEPGNLTAAATISYPDGRESPPEMSALRETVWAELGSVARARYDAFGAACAQFQLDVPQTHLNMLGVRRSAQGTGLGRRLVDFVHQMSRDDASSTGVSLSTEDEANIAFYEHLGYKLVGSADVSPELHTWSFFRRDSAADTR